MRRLSLWMESPLRATTCIILATTTLTACNRQPEPTKLVTEPTSVSIRTVLKDASGEPNTLADSAQEANKRDAISTLEWTKLEPVGDLGTSLRLEAKATYARGKVPVLLVTAPWCTVCKAFKGALAKSESDPRWAKIRLLEVDGDIYTERLQAMGLKVAFFPTLSRFSAQGSFEDEVSRPSDGVAGLLRTLENWARRPE